MTSSTFLCDPDARPGPKEAAMDLSREELIHTVAEKLLVGAQLSFPDQPISEALWNHLDRLAFQGLITPRQWNALQVLFEHLGGELVDPLNDLELGLDTFMGSFSKRELARLEGTLGKHMNALGSPEQPVVQRPNAASAV